MLFYYLYIILYFVVMCFVGNKNDFEESREVNVKDVQEYVDFIGVLFYEIFVFKNVGKDILFLFRCMFFIYRIEK